MRATTLQIIIAPIKHLGIETQKRVYFDFAHFDFAQRIAVQVALNEVKLRNNFSYALQGMDKNSLVLCGCIADNPEMADVYHPTIIRGNVELGSFLDADELKSRLAANGVTFDDFTSQKVNLEDAFIGLTGKY